jgi:predicted MFS family arabinose efflux permease
MFNKVIKILILSDFFLFSAWGLIMPILAIFVVGQIKGGDAQVVGIAIGIYWILKSLIQVPVGRYLDKNHGEKDDYYFMIVGMFLASFIPLGFIFASLPWHIYALQAIHAIAMAMAIPPWGGIFVRHIDKGKEAMTWGAESSSVGIGVGVAGIIGGTIAKILGFTPLFIGVSILGMVSVCLLLLISKNLIVKPKDKDRTISFPKI